MYNNNEKFFFTRFKDRFVIYDFDKPIIALFNALKIIIIA